MLYVFDTSALMAFAQSEKGKDKVIAAFAFGVLSAVNYSEFLAKASDKGFDLNYLKAALQELNIPIIPFDEHYAETAAALRLLTRKYNISFADRACLATAKIRSLTALTADRQWLELTEITDIKIELIR